MLKGEGDVQKWSLIGVPLCYFLICDWKKIVPRPLSYVFLPTELISGVKLGLGSLPGVKKGDFLIFSNFFHQFLPNPSLTAPPYLHSIEPKFLVHVAWWYGYCWWDFQEPNSTITALEGLDVDGKMPIFTNQRWASPIKHWPLVRLGSKLTSMGSDSVAMIFLGLWRPRLYDSATSLQL